MMARFPYCWIVFLFALLPSWGQAQVKHTFPKAFKKLSFEMSMEEFARKRKTVDPNQLSKDKFRYVWIETFSEKHPFHTVKYYFSDKEDRPFYELILFYRDLPARDAWLRKYFGNPNVKQGTEWLLANRKGQQFKAWRYEDRLIIAIPMAGTEWEE